MTELFRSIIQRQFTIVEQERLYTAHYEAWYNNRAMKEHFRNESYFNLLRGETVTRGQIVAEDPNAMSVVNSMVKFGRIVGQFDLFGELYLYPTVKYRKQERMAEAI